MQTLIPPTFVPGVPASYSTSKAAAWFSAIMAGLASYQNASHGHAADSQYEVILHFLIDPGVNYGTDPRFKTHGPDLDNIVKPSVEALATDSRGNGLKAIWSDVAVYRLVASKEIVDSDRQTGAWYTVRVL